MKFIQLVSALRLIDAQLAHAIATDDKASRHARLLRDSADLLERIESHEPASATELQEMVGFFSRRSLGQRDAAAGRRDFEIAVSLVRRFGDSAFRAATDEDTPGHDVRAARGNTSDPFELARRVSESRERLAAISASYRFLAVSELHAKSCKSSPMAMIDRHLCEVIGSERFQKRARRRIDQCFQGTPQDYIYLLDDPIEGQRVVRCTMTPVGDAKNRIYCALIQTRDVTSEARHMGRIPQNEPGTT